MISNNQSCPKMQGTCPRQKENFLDNVWKRYIEYGSGAEKPKKLSTSDVKRLLNVALWEQGLCYPLNGSRRHEFKVAQDRISEVI
jgi:hypothetical protein